MNQSIFLLLQPHILLRRMIKGFNKKKKKQTRISLKKMQLLNAHASLHLKKIYPINVVFFELF